MINDPWQLHTWLYAACWINPLDPTSTFIIITGTRKSFETYTVYKVEFENISVLTMFKLKYSHFIQHIGDPKGKISQEEIWNNRILKLCDHHVKYTEGPVI